jgi:hypothetical protein
MERWRFQVGGDGAGEQAEHSLLPPPPTDKDNLPQRALAC